MKSALKSIRDPGHEEAIDAIHGYCQNTMRHLYIIHHHL